jgi:hypothetical protein
MIARWSEPSYEAIVRLLSARTGLAFGSNRQSDAEAGIRRAMNRAGTSEISEYLLRLQTGDADLDTLVSELTVGETYFFREPMLPRTLMSPSTIGGAPGSGTIVTARSTSRTSVDGRPKREAPISKIKSSRSGDLALSAEAVGLIEVSLSSGLIQYADIRRASLRRVATEQTIENQQM